MTQTSNGQCAVVVLRAPAPLLPPCSVLGFFACSLCCGLTWPMRSYCSMLDSLVLGRRLCIMQVCLNFGFYHHLTLRSLIHIYCGVFCRHFCDVIWCDVILGSGGFEFLLSAQRLQRVEVRYGRPSHWRSQVGAV